MPKKLVVIGGGVIGSEYAGTFAALGVEVHLVDGRDTLMPFLDAEISRALADAMAANGVQFHWKERVTACDASQPGDVVLTLSSRRDAVVRRRARLRRAAEQHRRPEPRRRRHHARASAASCR